jgi:hypothetical protein
MALRLESYDREVEESGLVVSGVLEGAFGQVPGQGS